MKTTVFVSRHSESFRNLLGEYNCSEIEQIRNEKNPLSVNGEFKAQKLSEYLENYEINVLYSSNYVRAMSTAKYVAESKNIKLNVDSRFGERKFGVKVMSELPTDFFDKQSKDWDFKLEDGESLNEVSNRMYDAFMDVINNNIGKSIMIFSHGTALTTLFSKWCDIICDDENGLLKIYYKASLVFDGNWSAPELFKLEFEDNELVTIENIKY